GDRVLGEHPVQLSLEPGLVGRRGTRFTAGWRARGRRWRGRRRWRWRRRGRDRRDVAGDLRCAYATDVLDDFQRTNGLVRREPGERGIAPGEAHRPAADPGRHQRLARFRGQVLLDPAPPDPGDE